MYFPYILVEPKHVLPFTHPMQLLGLSRFIISPISDFVNHLILANLDSKLIKAF